MDALRSAYLLLLLGTGFKGVLGIRNPDADFRAVTLELSPALVPSDRVIVTNKPAPLGATSPFSKYAVFGFDTEAYFNATAVTVNHKKIVLNGQDLKYPYVYDAYSFWNGNQILAVGFRLYNPGIRSQYQYVRLDSGVWSMVDGSAFDANPDGFIGPEGLRKMLTQIDSNNRKRAMSGTSNFRGSDSTKYTVAIISVALALVLVLVAFIVFFFLRT